MSQIKAVIWDFAGVVLLPVKGTFNSLLAERLEAPFEELERVMDGEMNELWDMAEIDDDTFFSYVLESLNLPAEKISILRRFVVKDFYIDQEMLAFIKKIKYTNTTMLLTNFPAHIHTFMKTDWIVNGAFEHVIASCDVKLLKPYPAIYKLALERMGYKGEECIFIDDRPVNVDTALNMSMHGVTYKTRSQTISDVEAILKSN